MKTGNRLLLLTYCATALQANPLTPFDLLGSARNYGLLMMGRVSLANWNAAGGLITGATPISGASSSAVFSHTEGGVFPAYPGDRIHVGVMNGATITTSGDPEFAATIQVGSGGSLDSDFRATGGGTNPLLGPGTGATPQGSIEWQTSPGAPLQAWESVTPVDAGLAQARTDVLAAYVAAMALPATSGITSLTSTQTITGLPGINVLNLTGGINLGNGEIVTLSGVPGTKFVLRVSTEFKFQTGGIRASGIAPTDIIYVVTDDLKMTASGGGGGVAVPALPPAYITGLVIMAHPDSEIGLAPGGILGQLFFGGMKADFPSGGRIAATPEPGTWTAGLLSLAALGWTVRRRRYARNAGISTPPARTVTGFIQSVGPERSAAEAVR